MFSYFSNVSENEKLSLDNSIREDEKKDDSLLLGL